MKKLGLLCALLLALCTLGARAEEAEISLPLSAPTDASAQVRVSVLNNENWLFLPSFADVRALFPKARQTKQEGVWEAALSDGTSVFVMQSENLRAVFLFSDDPLNAGRAFVDGGEKHATRATGSLALVSNGTAIPSELLENGTVRCTFTFEDLSYRPVDYLGDDLGLVFDYDTYVARYPEVLDICGGDPEAVLEYFCDEGMYEGQMANDFFSPEQILIYNPGLKYTLGEDWQNYYWDLLYYGYEEGWLLKLGRIYRPSVSYL